MKTMGVIQSINIANPGQVTLADNCKMFSGIHKKPVSGKIYLDTLGFNGDGVADPRHHGGEDKAVCVYCIDHYPYWEKELGRKLRMGNFGENLSVTGLNESRVHIGDIFRIGEAQVQCSQPRQPCHKLNKIFDLQEMACQVQTTGYSGYYLRVIEAGWVEPGAEIVFVHEDKNRFSIEAANDLMHKNKSDVEKIREILSIDALSTSWRETFQNRLEQKAPVDESLRLQGN